MIRYTTLSAWPTAIVPAHTAYSHLDTIGWVPLSDGELLLASHYFPLAVRLDGTTPVIGALVRRDMMVRALVSPNGAWSGAYTPIALRCFPLRLAGPSTGDPITDTEIARIAPGPTKPRGLTFKDEAGLPSKDLASIYEGLRTIEQGQARLAPALDLLLVAGVLAAIPEPEPLKTPDWPQMFTVARRDFAMAQNHTLEAMTRTSFTSIDLVTVLTFSQTHLRSELRPAAAGPVNPVEATPTAEQSYGFESILPWLDTSELFPVAWATDSTAWLPETPALLSARAMPPPTG